MCERVSLGGDSSAVIDVQNLHCTTLQMVTLQMVMPQMVTLLSLPLRIRRRWIPFPMRQWVMVRSVTSRRRRAARRRFA